MLKHYDLIGVGFGPSGIALAAAIDDLGNEGKTPRPLRAKFFEKQAGPAWQSEMLLPGTDIQHHFLRDFATPRNPRSHYTFANYLSEVGRLFDFGLLGGNPGRIEWADYCRWVADQLSGYAAYNREVTAIEPIAAPERDREVDRFLVRTHDRDSGAEEACTTSNLVISTGRTPHVPQTFAPHLGPTVFHSHNFLSKVKTAVTDPGMSVAVIGSGQSAIEIILYLADLYPQANITSISRGNGFRLYDLGHFSNQVFSPDEVDYFHSLPAQARARLLDDIKPTNYSGIDPDVSRALYWRVYEDRVQGRSRISMLKRTAVDGISQKGTHWELDLRDTYSQASRSEEVDLVILCTGYEEEAFPPLLRDLAPLLVLEDGCVSIGREYEVHTADHVSAGLFINGIAEHSHGISDSTSFSMMAVKAQVTLSNLRILSDRTISGPLQPLKEVA